MCDHKSNEIHMCKKYKTTYNLYIRLQLYVK